MNLTLMRLMRLHRLLEGEVSGDAPAGGATAAAPTPTADPAAATADTGLTPPESLLSDKADDAQKPEGNADATKPEDTPKPDEPVKYTDFTLPEGVTLDEAKFGEFQKIAGEAKLPQEVAQKFVDLYTSELKQLTEAPMRAWTQLQSEWQEAVRNDPVIGGANLDKNLAATKAGLKNLLGEESKSFFEALEITGAGNNPAILRGIMKAAAPHAPASPVAGSPGKPSKTAGETLYPKMAGLGNGYES